MEGSLYRYKEQGGQPEKSDQLMTIIREDFEQVSTVIFLSIRVPTSFPPFHRFENMLTHKSTVDAERLPTASPATCMYIGPTARLTHIYPSSESVFGSKGAKTLS